MAPPVIKSDSEDDVPQQGTLATPSCSLHLEGPLISDSAPLAAPAKPAKRVAPPTANSDGEDKPQASLAKRPKTQAEGELARPHASSPSRSPPREGLELMRHRTGSYRRQDQSREARDGRLVLNGQQALDLLGVI